ncbi:hypothetical protein [Legionella moravica]|uniref:hypothetical protein n=1 Tax=Legionella moravica TaxID=39962 RepID=UPI00042753CF|nr:hypothetical protein [Legionella moravica]
MAGIGYPSSNNKLVIGNPLFFIKIRVVSEKIPTQLSKSIKHDLSSICYKKRQTSTNVFEKQHVA